MEGEAIELCPSDNDSGIVFTAVENNMLELLDRWILVNHLNGSVSRQ